MLQNIWNKIIADPKTTVVGVLSFAAWLVAKFGLDFSTTDQAAILAFAVLVLGIVSRDTKQIPPTGS